MLLSHQTCCLLYYSAEINSGIHMYQFTFKLLHFCFRMWLWCRIWTKILADRRIWRKKARIGGFAYPYSPPSSSFRNSCLLTIFFYLCSVVSCSQQLSNVADFMPEDCHPKWDIDVICKTSVIWSVVSIPSDIAEVKHARFWGADGNRKWSVFTFNLPSHNHIHNAKYLFSIRDE